MVFSGSLSTLNLYIDIFENITTDKNIDDRKLHFGINFHKQIGKFSPDSKFVNKYWIQTAGRLPE